jgi:hypothetical protein
MPLPDSIQDFWTQAVQRGLFPLAIARKRYSGNPVVAAAAKTNAEIWRKANPDKIKAKGRAYRTNNPAQALLEKARERARKGGYACTIKVADISIPEFCPLLGIKLERGKGVGGVKPSSTSLDKIHPELGYVPGNVWVISYRANVIKSNATLKELQTLVTNLTRYVS